MNIDTTKIKTIQNLIDTLSTLSNKSNPITLNVKGSMKNGVLNMQNTTNLNVKINNSPGLKMFVTLWGEYDNDYIQKIIKHNIEILQPQTVTFWNLDDLIEYSKKVDNKQMFIAMESNVYNQIAEAARLSILLEQPNTIYVDADMIINDNIRSLISNNQDKDIISGWLNGDNSVSACSGTFLYHGNTNGKALKEYYSYFNSDKYDPQYNDLTKYLKVK